MPVQGCIGRVLNAIGVAWIHLTCLEIGQPHLIRPPAAHCRPFDFFTMLRGMGIVGAHSGQLFLANRKAGRNGNPPAVRYQHMNFSHRAISWQEFSRDREAVGRSQ